MWRSGKSVCLFFGLLTLFSGSAQADLWAHAECWDSYGSLVGRKDSYSEVPPAHAECSEASADASYGQLSAQINSEYGDAWAEFRQMATIWGPSGEVYPLFIQFYVEPGRFWRCHFCVEFTVDGTLYDPEWGWGPLVGIGFGRAFELAGHAETYYYEWDSSASLSIREMRVCGSDLGGENLRLLGTFEGLKQGYDTNYYLVPEPSAFLLIGSGLAVLVFWRPRSVLSRRRVNSIRTLQRA